MEKLAVEGKGNVFATDAILAHLMASPRTIYPWDIVVQKVSWLLTYSAFLLFIVLQQAILFFGWFTSTVSFFW